MERPDSVAGQSDEAIPPGRADRDKGAAARLTRHRQAFWSRAAIFIVWAVTLGLLAIALLRLTYHDGRHPLIWLNAFTRYLYFPAYGCLMLAVCKRRISLAITNLAIIGCHVYWMTPDLIRDRRADAITSEIVANAATSAKLRIFFANVRNQNPEIDAFLDETARVDPDVIVIAEYSLPWALALHKSPMIAGYPYGDRANGWKMGDLAVFSRIPIEREAYDQFADRVVRSMDIKLGAQTLRLVGLHAPRPMNFHENDYDGFWKRALPLIESEPHPLVLVGDCNATQYSLVYETLKATGLRSAHEDRGRGFATTWPNGTLPLPPIRIDQAFLSPDVACTGISEGEGRGSDHKPVILDVQIRNIPRN
jgi:endonuclease/exonuclease/phosphatase (EEP) superfamily protein YafD